MSDTIRTGLEQGRAKVAYGFATEGKQGKDGAKSKEYKSYCKKIPMMIKTNGLGATYAFMKSKGGTYTLLYQQTYEWLQQDDKLGIFNSAQSDDLVEIIISQNSAEYRYLTIEVLALFNWLRRFAEGLIDGEENGGE
jgi:CRISPR-associated protein Cmr5